MTFPADGTNMVPAPVTLVNDEKDEADIQFFVIYLEIIDAPNVENIEIRRKTSICQIVDDDRE